MLITIIFPFVQNLISGVQTVRAVTETTVLTAPQASATASYAVRGEKIEWTVDLKKDDNTDTQFGIRAVDGQDTPVQLTSDVLDKTAESGNDWYVEKTLGKTSTTITFTTPKKSHVVLYTMLRDANGATIDTSSKGVPFDLDDASAQTKTAATQPQATSTSTTQPETKTNATQKTTNAASSRRSVAKAAATQSATAKVSAQAADTPKSINQLAALDDDGQGNKTIFTGATFTDKNGNPLTTVHYGDQIVLGYTWAIPEAARTQINEGDYFDFTLPKNLKINLNAGETLSGDLSDSTGTVFGKFVIQADGQARITFTDNVKTHSKIKGTLHVSGTVVFTDDGTTPGLDVPFVDKDGTTVPSIVVPNQTALSKMVVARTADNDIKNDQATIRWQLGINKTISTLSADTVISDTLPDGVTYTGNEHLTAYTVKPDGSLGAGQTVNFADVFNVDRKSNPVKFTFKSGADRSKYYELQFDTAADLNTVRGDKSDKNVQVTNQAELTQSDQKPVTASASTDFTSSVGFKKAGVLEKDGVVAWIVEVTPNGLSIPAGADLLDVMNNNQVLTDAQGNPVSADELSSAVTVSDGGPSLHVTGSQGTYHFATGAKTTKPFTLTYYTKSTNTSGANISYNNRISWGNDNGNHTVTKDASGVVKDVTKQNDVDHTVSYAISVNTGHQTITKAKVADVVGTGSVSGIYFANPDDLAKNIQVVRVAKGSQTETTVAPSDYSITGVSKNGFTVVLDNAIDKSGTTDTFIVRFTANYTPGQNGRTQRNSADYFYTSDGSEFEESTWRDITPGKLARVSGSKSGDLNPMAGTIDWTINLNTKRDVQLGANGQLVDTLPKGLSLQDVASDGTLTAGKQFSVTKNGAADDQVTAVYDAAKRQVIFSSFASDASAYKITLKTTVDAFAGGPLADINIKNTAVFTSETSQTSQLTATVSYNRQKNLISKGATQNPDNPNNVTYTVLVNPDTPDNQGSDKLNFKAGTTVVDKVSDGAILKVDPASFKVTTASGDPLPASAYKLDPSEQGFELKFLIDFNYEVKISYEATILIPATALPGAVISPSNTVTIDGTYGTASTTNKDVHITNADAGGSAEGVTGSLSLVKKDADMPAMTLPGAKFSLYRVDGNGQIGAYPVAMGTTNAKGELQFTGLTLGQYRLIETEAPDGYQISPELATGKDLTVADDTQQLNQSLVFTNKAVVTVAGTKTWHDADNQDGKRPSAITVNLLANGQRIATKTVTAADGWKYSFTNLPKYANGQVVNYTIDEDAVADYTKQIDNYDLTNTHTPETTRVAGTKTWHDANNQDGKRPDSITINLLANDKKVDSVKVSAKDDWKYAFTNLPKYAAGALIQYRVTEDAVAGYDTAVSGFNVTNSYTPEVTQVTGTKTWHDADDQDGKRPSKITVDLLANGKQVQSTTADAKSDWKYGFTNLPKYANGKLITYTMAEETVPDYKTTIDGFDLTNTHTPELTQVAGAKTWHDADDQDGKRPSEITVNLLANGKQVQSATTDAKSDWKYSFTDLPKYADGQKITYTVNEDAVPDYKTTIDGFDLTNTHTPELTQVAGVKTWDDAHDQDGKRPSEITVNLLVDGKKVQTTTADVASDWKYSFTDLPKYADGKVIAYTVAEEAVPDYKTQVDGFDLTNTHTPELTQVSGVKTWDDADNQDGKRPSKITVNLLANGQQVQSTTTDAEHDWKYSFSDLPKYADGQVITYMVAEEAVPDYTTQVNGFDLTNTHTPEVTQVAGVKTWDDADNQDGKRPNAITVNLLANGKQVQTTTADAASDWKYSFTDLPKYADGQVIAYTVTEDAVPDYKTTIDGFNLTNTHTPETVQVAGTKIWRDANDRNHLRPSAITVNLLANGQQVQTTTVTAMTGWKYSFTNLPKYVNGQLITYMVTENKVAHYSSRVDGFDVINTLNKLPHQPNHPTKPNHPNAFFPQTGEMVQYGLITIGIIGLLAFMTLAVVVVRKRMR